MTPEAGARIAVAYDGDEPVVVDRARDLATALGIDFSGAVSSIGARADPTDASPPAPPALLLTATADGLELREAEHARVRGVHPDLARIDTRVATGNLSRKQPLPRAIGRDAVHVVDATAGLGHDAALLALMGYRVTAIERSPVLAALLNDGLDRAAADDAFAAALGGRLCLRTGDARAVLPTIDPAPDTVYIDPMYPPRPKAALPKKPIRIVRALVGADTDSSSLLEAACACAHRVVVKRPHYAVPIGTVPIGVASTRAPIPDRTPAFTISSKLVRYDVYIGEGGGAAAETD